MARVQALIKAPVVQRRVFEDPQGGNAVQDVQWPWTSLESFRGRPRRPEGLLAQRVFVQNTLQMAESSTPVRR